MCYRNAPLITEAARGANSGYPFLKTLGSGHNIIRFDGKDPMQYLWPSHQNLVKFVSLADMEYAVLDCRQDKLVASEKKRRGHGDAETLDVFIRHFRHIIYLKPDLFIIYDSIMNAPFASDYRLHCYAEEVRFDGSHAFFTGRNGIDLDVAVVLPEHPSFSSIEAIDTHSVEFGNDPGKPYLVVLSPRESGSLPTVECVFYNGVLTIGLGMKKWKLEFKKSGIDGIYDIERKCV